MDSMQDKSTETEQLTAQQKLEISEQRLAEAQQLAHVGIWEMDMISGQVWWSNELYELFDMDPQKAPPEFDEFIEMVHRDDQEAFIQSRKEYLETQQVTTIEHRVVVADGSIRFHRSISRAEHNEKGEAIRLLGTTQDITDRKKSEVEIKENLARYRVLFDLSPNGIIVQDDQGIMIDVNQAVCEAMGYSRKELIGNKVHMLAPKDRHAEVDEVIQRILQGEKMKYTVRNLRKDGHITISELNESRISLGQGKVGIVAVSHTVTEQTKVRQELEENLNRYRTLFELSPSGILIEDEQGTILEVNDAQCRSVGYEREELIGNKVHMFAPEEHWPLVDAHIAKVMAGETLSHVVEGRNKEGQVVYSALHETRISLSQGKQGILLVTTDITEQRKVQRKLEENLNRYRALFEHSPSGILILDDQGTILQVNDAQCKSLGYNREEVIGKKVHMLTAKKYWNDVNANIARIIDGENLCHTVRPLRKDGEQGYVVLNETRIPLGDGKMGILSISLDVTQQKKAEEEKKRLEEQMLQTQKMESLGVLAGGVAHDFNNILMGILGHADLAMQELPSDSPLMSRMKEIEIASQRAAELCSQMLAYSGRGHFIKESVDVNKVVREMGQLLKVSISKSTKLEYKLARNIDKVNADPTQIRQIVMNLILNASESIDEKSGRIVLSTGVIDCDQEYLSSIYLNEKMEDGKYVFFEVSDTGSGMNMETLEKIFDPFFTTKFTGRGLGLAALLGIVRGHHGTIKVNSVMGEGSTIRILLPVATDNDLKLSKKGEKNTKESKQSGTILLVDDEETVRSVCGQMLEQMGFDVIMAEDGPQAIEVFRNNADEIKCVLLDMTMPKMNGAQTYEALYEIEPKINVIISSGYNEEEVAENFVNKNISGFLQKPFNVEVLSKKIRSALGIQ